MGSDVTPAMIGDGQLVAKAMRLLTSCGRPGGALNRCDERPLPNERARFAQREVPSVKWRPSLYSRSVEPLPFRGFYNAPTVVSCSRYSLT